LKEESEAQLFVYNYAEALSFVRANPVSGRT